MSNAQPPPNRLQLPPQKGGTQLPVRRVRRAEPAGLWLALVGASLSVHVLVALCVMPWLGQMSAQTDPLDINPIDLVELPNPLSSSLANLPSSGAGGASPIASAPPADSQPSRVSPASGDQTLPSVSSGIGIAPVVSPSAPPSISTPQPAPPQPQPIPSSIPVAPQAPVPMPTLPVPSSPQPTASATPLVETFSIDRPPPDVSGVYAPPPVLPSPSPTETLSPPAVPTDPSQLAQVGTLREVEPVRLTASLQIVSLLPEAGTPETDESLQAAAIAQPQNTVEGV
ncbi:MAG: hypothetical protein HC772_08825, partial [Leptolyngbyaceae cyanobacterium CRU_2_3]|nr:hypothetical protein [Leptolyngbyaceae cyanobacterium CRU_2_3]